MTQASSRLGAWRQTNQKLIAKAIGELSFEQILIPVQREPGSKYRVDLKSGVSYEFEAWQTVWDFLRVKACTVTRVAEGRCALAEDAAQFFIDAQGDLEMTDIVLGNFLEEMNSTLFSDVTLFEKTKSFSASELSSWSGLRIQAALNGHPKILLNKGRMGWSVADLEQYAPESEKPFQLYWIAVESNRAVKGFADGTSSRDLLKVSFESHELELLETALELEAKRWNRSADDYVVVPVHPWQWDRYIQIQFASELAQGALIGLGLMGDQYLPQISLRTLSNVSRPRQPDIKLPLSILNTSAIRGISSRYIAMAPKVSSILASLCETDTLLKSAGVTALKESAGVSFDHPAYSKIPGAPYRYREYLGAIWRESAESHLRTGEQAIMTGTLFHQDHDGRSLIGALITSSGLTTRDWLSRYFDCVVVPLYHLQLRYGIGLVSHGQNIVLKLTDSVPSGVFLKDFQGDLRVSERALSCGVSSVAELTEYLDKLPTNYLIHDLITGHFLTVLRFVSATLEESDGFKESDFYAILRQRIQAYLRTQADVPKELNLLNERFHRVLLNKVRFKIGYADSAERPLPLLGTDLKNPLSIALTNGGTHDAL